MELTTYKAEHSPSGHEGRDSIFPLGRLTAKQTAQILGFSEDKDITILIAADLLEPLGHPNANCQKYFAWEDIRERARDVKWLAKATDAIYGHHAKENASRRSNKEDLKQAA